MPIDYILQQIDTEYTLATGVHGRFNSAHEGYAVLLEEVEELKAEVFKHAEQRSLSAMRKEAIQIAAMACRFITDIVEKEVKR